jgi:hypothetical protein
MVDDVFVWWHEQCAMFPQLSHMALDYLSIPGAQSAFFDEPYDELRSLPYYQQHQLMLSMFLVEVASSHMSKIVSPHKVQMPFFALGHRACKFGGRIRMSWPFQ